MSELAKLQAEQVRLEAAKKETDEALKAVKKNIGVAAKTEAENREKFIGKLARDAGLADWEDEKLMAAFRQLVDPSAVPIQAVGH